MPMPAGAVKGDFAGRALGPTPRGPFDRLTHLAGPSCRSRRQGSLVALISRVAKTKQRPEDKPQQDQSNGEADSLAKALCDLEKDEKRDDEANDGDEEQDEPPPGFARDLDHDEKVVERHNGRPAGLSGLFKCLPSAGGEGDEHQEWEECFHGVFFFGVV